MGNPPTDDAANALKIHNDARAGKNLAPLEWDDDLSRQATEYAQALAAADNGLNHSGTPGQGENLYAEMGIPDPPASQGAQAWINESNNYHGEKIGEGDFGSFGHYSELLALDDSLFWNNGKDMLTPSTSSMYVV